MGALVTTYGIFGGSTRKVIFAKNTVEEMQEICRLTFGKIPYRYRVGIPSSIIYTVEEYDPRSQDGDLAVQRVKEKIL